MIGVIFCSFALGALATLLFIGLFGPRGRVG
jgi:hypothetical protein